MPLKNVSVLKHWLQEFEQKNKEHYKKNLIDNKRSKDVLNHHTNKENLPAVVDDNIFDPTYVRTKKGCNLCRNIK